MERFFIGKGNDLTVVDRAPEQKGKSEGQKRFIDLIRNISVHLSADFSIEKFGPIVSISGRNNEDDNGYPDYVWINIDFESGEIFITKVNKYFEECDRLKIDPYDAMD